jgi:hypothetical protein
MFLTKTTDAALTSVSLTSQLSAQRSFFEKIVKPRLDLMYSGDYSRLINAEEPGLTRHRSVFILDTKLPNNFVDKTCKLTYMTSQSCAHFLQITHNECDALRTPAPKTATNFIYPSLAAAAPVTFNVKTHRAELFRFKSLEKFHIIPRTVVKYFAETTKSSRSFKATNETNEFSLSAETLFCFIQLPGNRTEHQNVKGLSSPEDIPSQWPS